MKNGDVMLAQRRGARFQSLTEGMTDHHPKMAFLWTLDNQVHEWGEYLGYVVHPRNEGWDTPAMMLLSCIAGPELDINFTGYN